MGRRANPITRRLLMGFMAAVAVRASTVAESADDAALTAHKDPNCGCCSGWVQHLRDAGFTVPVQETADLDSVRARLGLPPELTACHTAEVNGYVLEGHVPAAAVRRLLSERPLGKRTRRAWHADRIA